MQSFFRILFVSLLFGLSPLTSSAAPVDINSADAKSLDANLNGVGPKGAAAIVAYRAKHGPFRSVDDLAKVKGIGPKVIEKNRANMTVGQPAAAVQVGSPSQKAAP